MHVFLNGRLVPEAQAMVSVFDRGFLYGDGLFETMRVYGGRAFRWAEHYERFWRGAEFLKIEIPFGEETLRTQAGELIKRNDMPECLLRMTLSRGVGLRGYSPRGAERPTLVLSTHAAPAENEAAVWKVITASCRIPAGEPLAQFKNCNKLPQILARAEAEAAGADEALLLNTDGSVVEASSSNLFWVQEGAVCTPALESGILAGVTRLVVMEICETLGLRTLETEISTEELRAAEGIFLSLSSRGVVEIDELDGRALKRSPMVARVRDGYEEWVRRFRNANA